MKQEEIYKMLGFEGKDGFATLDDPEWANKVHLQGKVVSLIHDESSPFSQMSALFVFGGRPLIFFFDHPTDKKALFKAIWNYNEVPVVVIQEDDHIDVFNGFAYEKELESLQLIGNDTVINQFSYFKLVTGTGWEEYKEKLAYRNRVDYYLLKNIQFAQLWIQKTGVPRNLANRLIGKVIFLRYLTDRCVVLNFEGKKRALTNEDIIELLQDKKRLAVLFETLQDKHKGFNGDLFKISKEELAEVPDAALQVLVRLLRSDDLEDGSQSLFDVYDFSILPIEFISNVYERFIGKENQEREGAYYTPLFLVEYIVENTVARHLAKATTSGCKVLDPACGSGIFLVETLRRIIDHYIAHASQDDLQGQKFQQKLKELVKDNIFGIDNDESAVQVAAFSIYLTLLDYQKPADISSFRFPNLLGKNLICQDAFDEVLLDHQEFDFIIGNPPWNRGRKDVDENGAEIVPAYQRYVKEKARVEHRTKIIGNQEIAQAFVVRTLDFMGAATQAAMVLTSKVLYNGQSYPFRSYLLENALIDSVLELSSVRHEVFSQSSDPSIAPACVLLYRKKDAERPEDGHLITHTAVKPSVFFSLFKVLSVEKADIQHVRQDLLYQYDYLWKTLLYGTYLDFLFVKRLKGMKTIQQVIDGAGFEYGQGVICGNERNRTYDISGYVGKKKIDAGTVRQYVIIPTDERWELPTAQRGRRPQLFEAPLLLVKKSLDSNDYSCRAAICTEDVVYTDALTGIHSNDMPTLRNIAGTLNSQLFNYYALMCLGSAATEREQGHNKEKFSMPYVGGDIFKKVEKIEKIYANLVKYPLQPQDWKLDRIRKEKGRIEASIARELCMSDEEQSLIDYANAYSIPMATGNLVALPLENNRKGKKLIADYASVFQRRFDGQFGEGLCLNCKAEINQTHLVLRFQVAKEQKPIEYRRGSYSSLEAFLLSISTENISEHLFLRKDIRGFEKDGFYIIKPSEQRLWHRAVAYIDVQEFVDALLANN